MQKPDTPSFATASYYSCRGQQLLVLLAFLHLCSLAALRRRPGIDPLDGRSALVIATPLVKPLPLGCLERAQLAGVTVLAVLAGIHQVTAQLRGIFVVRTQARHGDVGVLVHVAAYELVLRGCFAASVDFS